MLSGQLVVGKRGYYATILQHGSKAKVSHAMCKREGEAENFLPTWG